jgi:hypothetical protein
MAVRHCVAPGNPNARPKPRAAISVSATWALPPDNEKRPITGVRPDRNTTALETSLPLPLPSK